MVNLIVILMLVGDLLVWWWGDRRLRPLGRRGVPLRVALGVLIGAQFAMLVWWRLFPDTLRPLGYAFWKPVSAWLYMWHLLVLPAALAGLLVGYLGKGLWRVGRTWAAKPQAAEAANVIESPLPYPTRRQVITAAAAFVPQAALGGSLLVAGQQEGKFRIRELDIPLAGLPKALDGAVIAHLSDTHAGRFVGPRELEAIARATISLKPDLIAFTGDLIDFNLVDLPPAIDAFRQMQKVAPVAMCVGNHDIFEDGRAFRTRVRQSELGILVDEGMPLTVRGARVEVLGMDWGTPTAPRADGMEMHIDRVLSRRQAPSAFPILLAHHPHAFDLAAAAGVPLTLAGHTHGGQIMLTEKFGAGSVYRYFSGPYEKQHAKLVVSNGVGNWFPLRINAPAEIVKITLRAVS